MRRNDSSHSTKMNGRRIAITGARGRLAPGLVESFRKQGCRVTQFSRTPDDVFADIRELPERLDDFDAVLHMAWSTVPLISENNPGQERQRDFPFLRELANAMRLSKTAPQLVFFSTAAVYGNTDSAGATEETACRPLGRYAAAKLEAEQILDGMGCVLRVSNVFGGLSNADKPQGIIPRLYAASHGGEPAVLWGDGSATKDYIFEQDFREAVFAAVECGLKGTYNVASGQSLSLNEIVRLVEESTGKSLRLKHEAHYAWDVEFSRVNSLKFSSATRWRPCQDIRSAISSLMA